MRPNRILLLAVLTLGALVACQEPHSETPTPGFRPAPQSLVPPPENDALSQSAQLQRHLGQSRFLTPLPRWEIPSKADSRVNTDSIPLRVTGPAGTNLIYVLSEARGLHVLKSVAGLSEPHLVSRLEATGRRPLWMELDSRHARLLVIETDERGSTYFLTYDVARPESPVRHQIFSWPGPASAIERVGDHLMLAARGASSSEPGWLRLLDLGGRLVVPGDVLSLLPAGSSVTNLRLLAEDSKTERHLIVSGERIEGERRIPILQLITIGDSGVLRHLMMQTAGAVRNPDLVAIHQGEVLALSQVENLHESGVQAWTLEFFRWPDEETEILSPAEVRYRQSEMKRRLASEAGGTEESPQARTLLDKDVGLLGRFEWRDGLYHKSFADRSIPLKAAKIVSVHWSQRGLNLVMSEIAEKPARGQTVSFETLSIVEGRLNSESGEWVLSDPVPLPSGTRQAVPVSAGERTYWVASGVTKNGNLQANVLESTRTSKGQVRLQVVKPISWPSYQATADTVWKLRARPDGGVEIRVSEVKFGSETSGVLLTLFDPVAALENRSEDILRAPKFIPGADGPLRFDRQLRQLERLTPVGLRFHSAPDESGRMSLSGSVDLAAPIAATLDLSSGGHTRRVEILSEEAGRPARLRLQGESASAINLEGDYIAHLRERRTGALLVLTLRRDELEANDGGWDYRASAALHKVVLTPDGTSLRGAGVARWDISRTYILLPASVRSNLGLESGRPAGQLLQLNDGSIVAQVDTDLRSIQWQTEMKAEPLVLRDCREQTREDLWLDVFGAQLYLSSRDLFTDTLTGLSYTRNHFAPLTLSGASGACGPELNVPGQVRWVTPEGRIIAEDEWVVDIRRPAVSGGLANWSYATTRSLVALLALEDRAVLVDEMPLSIFGGAEPLGRGSDLILFLRQRFDSDWQLHHVRLTEEGEWEGWSRLLPGTATGSLRLVGLRRRDEVLTMVATTEKSVRAWSGTSNSESLSELLLESEPVTDQRALSRLTSAVLIGSDKDLSVPVGQSGVRRVIRSETEPRQTPILSVITTASMED